MKIAVCIAGCLRSWKSVFDSQTEFFQETLPKLLGQDVEVDWFYFIWNFNSISPCFTQDRMKGKRNELFTELTIPLTDVELYEFRDRCLKERTGVQKFKVGTVIESFEARNNYGEVLHADGSQQYGKGMVSDMRLLYEREHRFEYDIVFGSRFDLEFFTYSLLGGAEDIIPEVGVLKTVSIGKHGEVGDLLYWSKSREFTLVEGQFKFATSKKGKDYCQEMKGYFPEYRKKHYVESYCNLQVERCKSIREDSKKEGTVIYLNVEHAEFLWEQLNRKISL